MVMTSQPQPKVKSPEPTAVLSGHSFGTEADALAQSIPP
jgi:hypothetical protein